MIMTASTAAAGLVAPRDLMRCKQFNAELSTIGSFFLSLFFPPLLKQPHDDVPGLRLDRCNRDARGGPSAARSLRAISSFSVSNEARRRVWPPDFIGKRTESKTILYYFTFVLLGSFTVPSFSLRWFLSNPCNIVLEFLNDDEYPVDEKH